MKEKIIKIDAEPLEGFLIPITECKHFEGIGDCKEAKCLCVDNENCYFKQLKRLEQENKELKIYIESNKQQVEEVETLVMDNNRLQQETENLKDIIYYDVEKYKQALEEIRKAIGEKYGMADIIKIRTILDEVLNV